MLPIYEPQLVPETPFANPWGENSASSIAFVQAGIHSFYKGCQWQT